MPALKEYPLLVELSVEFDVLLPDVLLSLLDPEPPSLNWLMTKEVASFR